MWGVPGGLVIKDLPASAGNRGLIPVPGRSPGKGNGNPLSILAWEIQWTEESGRLHSLASQISWMQLSH